MNRVSSAITFALFLFVVLFVGAWYYYMQLKQERLQWQPSGQHEVEILETHHEGGEEIINMHQPFRPREYIRIKKSGTDV